MQTKGDIADDEDDGGEYVEENPENAVDDENTIQEEEEMCGKTDYTSELDDLQKEGGAHFLVSFFCPIFLFGIFFHRFHRNFLPLVSIILTLIHR